MKVIAIYIETAHQLQEQLQQLHVGHNNGYSNSSNSSMKVITMDIVTAHQLQEQLQQLHEGHRNIYRNSSPVTRTAPTATCRS